MTFAAIDLDPIIAAARPGETIYLRPGNYRTDGWREGERENLVKRGVTIRGSSFAQTIISVSRKHEGKICGIAHEGGNAFFDLTLDLGEVPEDWPHKRNGFYSIPTGDRGFERSYFERVHVMRYHGNINSGNNEGFGFIGGSVTLRECITSHPSGTYTLGFTFGDSVYIFGCRGILPKAQPGRVHSAFGLGWAKNARIMGCSSIGGNVGVYYDTHDIDGVQIADNSFVGCQTGVEIRNQHQDDKAAQCVRGVTIHRNHFSLSSSLPHVVGVSLVNNRADGQPIPSTKGFIDDTIIESNVFSHDTDVPKMGRGMRRAIQLATNCIDSQPGVAGINGVIIRGNQYQDCGSDEPWTHRNKLGQAKGILIENEPDLRWAQ